MTNTVDDLSSLYEDTKACAQLVGLSYIEGESDGISRHKQGNGFIYKDRRKQVAADRKLKKRIAELVIPPAWKDVWICPDDRGHILATGIDDKGRKQYIYHPKWRTMRDLIKFYRMIIFGKALPEIRKTIDADLARPGLDRDKVIGVMLWLLDNTYLRIGNDAYLVQNESMGLTTLSDKNLVVAGPVITLSFQGKSGQTQQLTFENKTVAAIINQLVKQRGTRLFRYSVGTAYVNIESVHINSYLHEISGVQISAKDFRTWGGTLMAFNHLVEIERLPGNKRPQPEKAMTEAVDAAANILGNTRAVAKSSYVHPDILELYAKKNFSTYYAQAKKKRSPKGLSTREIELLYVLERLFEDEFELVRTQK